MATNKNPFSDENEIYTFEATINSSEKYSGSSIDIPLDIEKTFGTKGRVQVCATFDGSLYRGTIANMGTGGHILIVTKAIREAINKKPGDTVKVKLQKDTAPRTVDMPQELIQLLAADQKLKAFYESLSFTNRKEYAVWISSAKREATKEKRVKETIKKLKKGLKNPTAK